MLKWLYRPICPSSLAAFRVIFGLLMLWEVGRNWAVHTREFPAWEFWALYEPLEFLRDWPRLGPETVFPVLAIAAAALLFGLCTRVAAAVFAVAYVYQFLLDPTHWNNHYYLIALFSFWLIFVRSEAVWSLDARLRPSRRRDFVPAWHLGIFRLQLAIVYFYGGLAKLRADWLNAQPVTPWLKVEQGNVPLIGPLLAEKSTAYFVAYFGLFFDLTIPFLLIYRRTRPYAIAVAVLFHLTNSQLFDIGVFPLLGIGSLIVFLDPDSPRRLMEWMSRCWRKFLSLPPREDLEIPSKPPEVAIPRSQCLIAGLLGCYFVVQLLLPFRHFFYESEVEWSEEGKHFAWRMMLSHKKTFVGLRVVDSATGISFEVDQGGMISQAHGIPRGEREVFLHEPQPGVRQVMMVPEKLLSRRHRAGKGVWGNPRLLAQYARYLAEEAKKLGLRRPRVYADAVASLNGRPFQYLVDPEMELAHAECPALETPRWIVPLKPDQPIGNYTSNNQEFYDRVMDVIESRHQKKAERAPPQKVAEGRDSE